MLTNRSWFRLSLTGLALVSMLQGCGSDSTKPDDGPQAGSIGFYRTDSLPLEPVVVVAESLPLRAEVIDTSGEVIPGATVTWSAVGGKLTVSEDGVVTGVSAGTSYVRASARGRRDSLAVLVLPLADSLALLPTVVGIVPGGVTEVIPFLYQGTDHLDAYGRVIRWTRSNNAIAVEGRYIGTVEGESVGSTQLTATGSGVSRSMTVDVSTPSYGMLDGGFRSTCGVTTTGRVYCWGVNISLQIGHPFIVSSATPLRVEGVPTATKVTVGATSACALAANGDAWCWGFDVGNLGRGTIAPPFESLPGKVTGGLQFTSLSMGENSTCGIVTGGAAYCWGYGGEGTLGTGDTVTVSTPTAVVGGHTYSQISISPLQSPSIGTRSACALGTDNKAWCWGNNNAGQIGDGTPVGGYRTSPVAVGGGLTFTSISAGGSFACGVATGGAGYCWGDNSSGALGSVGGNDSLPRAVLGSLTFSSISAGSHHACGLTTAGVAYCWGAGPHGELGNSAAGASSSPVPVNGGLTFASITTGVNYSCGVTTANVAWCWGGIEGETGTGFTGSLVPHVVTGQP